VTQTEQQFIGFFSYAHHDEKTDPDLISALTTELENRVNAKLLNASFRLWIDRAGLRTGVDWNREIENQIRGASVMIVLLTPSWLGSSWCRREYEIFAQVERERIRLRSTARRKKSSQPGSSLHARPKKRFQKP
jgi:hypothetical protein